MSNNSIESQSPLSWILAGPCFANKLTVLLWVFRNRLTPRVYRHLVNTTHLYDDTMLDQRRTRWADVV